VSDFGWNAIKVFLILIGVLSVWFFRNWGLLGFSLVLISLRFFRIHPQTLLQKNEDDRLLTGLCVTFFGVFILCCVLGSLFDISYSIAKHAIKPSGFDQLIIEVRESPEDRKFFINRGEDFYKSAARQSNYKAIKTVRKKPFIYEVFVLVSLLWMWCFVICTACLVDKGRSAFVDKAFILQRHGNVGDWSLRLKKYRSLYFIMSLVALFTVFIFPMFILPNSSIKFAIYVGFGWLFSHPITLLFFSFIVLWYVIRSDFHQINS